MYVLKIVALLAVVTVAIGSSVDMTPITVACPKLMGPNADSTVGPFTYIYTCPKCGHDHKMCDTKVFRSL